MALTLAAPLSLTPKTQFPNFSTSVPAASGSLASFQIHTGAPIPGRSCTVTILSAHAHFTKYISVCSALGHSLTSGEVSPWHAARGAQTPKLPSVVISHIRHEFCVPPSRNFGTIDLPTLRRPTSIAALETSEGNQSMKLACAVLVAGD